MRFRLVRVVAGAVLVAGVAANASAQVPPNAFTMGDRWYCRNGYERVADRCEPLGAVPRELMSDEIAAEDRAMIESACALARRVGASSYYECVTNQIETLHHVSIRPDLSLVAAGDRMLIELACNLERQTKGPATYYSCLDDELRALNARRTSEPARATDEETIPEPERPPPAAVDVEPRTAGDATPVGTAHVVLAATAAPVIQAVEPPPLTATATSEPPRDIFLVWFWLAMVAGGLTTTFFKRTAACRSCGEASAARSGLCDGCSRAASERAARESAERESKRRRNPPATGFDPYAVLQIRRTATQDDIRSAYREAMSKCHPDKFVHLGVEQQEAAKRKAQDVNLAYGMLRAH